VSDDGTCHLLNCGDSRTALAAARADGTGARVALATRDHAAADELERRRLAAEGRSFGCVGGTWRVEVDSPAGLWQVAVARALGGTEWRAAGISDAADVQTLTLGPEHRLLVVASDGVWGVDDEAGPSYAERSEGSVYLAAAARASGRSAGEAAHEVVARARKYGSTDNAGCVVLYLGTL